MQSFDFKNQKNISKLNKSEEKNEKIYEEEEQKKVLNKMWAKRLLIHTLRQTTVENKCIVLYVLYYYLHAVHFYMLQVILSIFRRLVAFLLFLFFEKYVKRF